MNWWHVSNAFIRRYNSNFLKACGSRNLKNSNPINVKHGGRWLSLWLRERGIEMMKICAEQLEYIAAERIKRSTQILHLYTRILDRTTLREIINIWKHHLTQNTRQLVTGVIGVSIYDWDRERISDFELQGYSMELENIHKLRKNTVVCIKCELRLVVDVTQPGVEYCKCHGVKPALASSQNDQTWQPFMEREDILVWRREEPGNRGLFAYKVYGSFPEVCAEDFLRVQVDVEYRKKWDPTARTLEIIDTDPSTTMWPKHYSDVVYWEMIWPRLFANRDYVFQRRWMINEDEGIIVIISQVTNHPKAPLRPDTHRVTTYWSRMVIKPYTELTKPGIEFALTYFEDPGVNVPSTIITWVAMSGLPNFLTHMRKASSNYRAQQPMDMEEVAAEAIKTENREIRDDSSASSDAKLKMKQDDIRYSSEPKTNNIDSQGQNPESRIEEGRECTSGSTADEKSGFLYNFLMSRLFV